MDSDESDSGSEQESSHSETSDNLDREQQSEKFEVGFVPPETEVEDQMMEVESDGGSPVVKSNKLKNAKAASFLKGLAMPKSVPSEYQK